MPKFSEYFSLSLTQHQLDFVDVSNEFDTGVYVDPYAIETSDDLWAAQASEYVRTFFKEVLDALRGGEMGRAVHLMSHLTEPKETFLGVSTGNPRGRGVGYGQARQLIDAIRGSKAYKSGILSDLSEMALYVDNIDRDKISDLTTNVLRRLLVKYTNEQCDLLGIETRSYSGPPLWDNGKKNWISAYVNLPYIENEAVILVPKYIVRRKLTLDGQDFYNKQITDFLVAEHYRANDSLVHMIKGQPRVYKTEVREEHPRSKSYIAEMVELHPELLEMYKDVARRHRALSSFEDDSPSINTVCASLASEFTKIPAGREHAEAYHSLVMGSLTALFYPDLIQPHKEWEIHDGRKRIDIVYTNAADAGFFSQRRSDPKVNANTIIVECKNYTKDIANQEFDQLLGRFDDNRGKLGILTYRKADNADLIMKRCRDAASRSKGYIIPLSDDDIVLMLDSKSKLNDRGVTDPLYTKYRDLLS